MQESAHVSTDNALKWWDGHKLPDRPAELEASRKFPENGSMLVGEKGKILVIDTDSPRLLPEEKMKGFEQPKPFLPRVRDHKGERLDAVRGGPPASSNFTDYGGPLAECVLLGNLAIAAGNKGREPRRRFLLAYYWHDL